MTLIRFCKENGINTNPKHRPIEEWYDEAQSVKQNLEWAKERRHQSISDITLQLLQRTSH